MNVAFFISIAGDKFSSRVDILTFNSIDFCLGKNVSLSSLIVEAINLGVGKNVVWNSVAGS